MDDNTIDDKVYNDLYEGTPQQYKSAEPVQPYVSPDETWEDPEYSNPP